MSAAVVFDKTEQEIHLFLRPFLLASISDETVEVFPNAFEFRAFESAQVGDEILHGLLRGGGMDDVLAGAVEEDNGVQGGQEQRMDA